MSKRAPHPGTCPWALGTENLLAYHDKEWGVPLRDDRKLFEYLILDAAQAGLSWSTILNRREGYRAAFDGFDAKKVARYDARKLRALMADTRIIRNRLKIQSAVTNAKAFLEVKKDFGSFSDFLWSFADKGKPKVNKWKTRNQVPARTDQSDALSKALKQRGFSFVGTTIVYAMMQAMGMVNDHLIGCPRHKACRR
jgi:DNA-3-methyladenine glycosylase I